MSLQFADFNADGHTDIVTATWEGTVFLVAGSADGWKKPAYIKDAEDRLILLSRYYDMVARKYDNSKPRQGDSTKKGDHLVSALAFDWDDDGDHDLLLGAKDGNLYLRRNDGTRGEPRFAGTNELLEAGGETFSVPGGMTAARPVDWDGDGRTDLVCGSFKGGAYLYRNTGKAGAPVFAAPSELLAPAKSPDGASGPESGWYVNPVDFDGDGDLDLLVGGHYMLQPKPRKLTNAEKERLRVVDTELKELQSKVMVFVRAVSTETKDASNEERMAAYRRMAADPEYKALSEKSSKLRREQMTLRPRARRTSGVWLYRRAGSRTSNGRPSGNGN